MTMSRRARSTTLRRFGFVAAVGAIAAFAQTAHADFESGWAAYQQGDFRGALSAWHPLAESGDPRAQFNLGHLFEEGKGVQQDSTRAVAWWRKAAEQGYVDAQINLANSLIAGDGVEQDLGKAAGWLKKAAGNGSARSRYKLGKMYSFGMGVPKNHAKA